MDAFEQYVFTLLKFRNFRGLFRRLLKDNPTDTRDEGFWQRYESGINSLFPLPIDETDVRDRETLTKLLRKKENQKEAAALVDCVITCVASASELGGVARELGLTEILDKGKKFHKNAGDEVEYYAKQWLEYKEELQDALSNIPKDAHPACEFFERVDGLLRVIARDDAIKLLMFFDYFRYLHGITAKQKDESTQTDD